MLSDPLEGFDWARLYDCYDKRCQNFSRHVSLLPELGFSANSDRNLYYELVKRFRKELARSGRLSGETYLAALLWKHYSHPSPVPGWIHPTKPNHALWRPEAEHLETLGRALRKPIGLAVSDIVDRLDELHGIPLRYMGNSKKSGLPTRTTLLHFAFPDLVPIVDKNVLAAVGQRAEKANQDISLYQLYVPYVRGLAAEYSRQMPSGHKETPIRMIDMALWVNRGRSLKAG